MPEKKTESIPLGTPDSRMYDLIFSIVRLWLGNRNPVEIDDALLHGVDAPYIMLVNHESFFDFYYVSKLAHPKKPSYLVNEYYCTRPVLRHMARRGGILSKKLFTPDLSTAVGLLRMIRKGYPVVIFPEGRLSADGRTNPVAEKGGALYKKLNADLVLTRIDGAYFAAPKWRPRSYRTKVRVRVLRVIGRAELKTMSVEALDRCIEETLYGDASARQIDRYPQRDKAVCLDAILYRCADCGALYATEGIGNELICRSCGSIHRLNDRYRFEGDPESISAWYERIKDMERKELDSISLRSTVRTKIHGANGGPSRRERGECRLTSEGFSYRSPSVEYHIPIEKLPALAFSCGKEFELYHKDELYYFYPESEPKQVARWALIVDLLNEKKEPALTAAEESFREKSKEQPSADQHIREGLS